MIADELRGPILGHAAREAPQECCGLIVKTPLGDVYLECANLARGHEHFELDPEDYARAEDMGEIVAVVHSHPNGPASPSQADRVACERTGLTWYIATGDKQIIEVNPIGYRAPLEGREFAHGVLDCYTLIRDYYSTELGIELPEFERRDNWWNEGGDLYRRNLQVAGFYLVEEPKKHDMILMQLKSDVPNHAAIYLGDMVILHHAMGRLSLKEVYGGFWQKITTHICRHRLVK